MQDFLINKKVFVAGHTGMVGSAVVRQLQQIGVECLTAKKADVDLTIKDQVWDFFQTNRPDFVVLAAAKVGGILANDAFPAEFITQNLEIQNNVITASHAFDVEKLMFLGSSCIYPKFANQPIQESALLTGSLEPTNQWYAIAKIAGLMQCRAYFRQYSRNFISVMPTNLYGTGDNFDLETSHVIPALLKKFKIAVDTKADSVLVWGSGTPRREFLHVDDCASAILHLLNSYSREEHINIGSGKDISIADLALKIKKISGFSGEIVFDTEKPDGAPQKLLDVSRLMETDWQPRISLDEGLKSVFGSL